jgi:hypothetical protein
MQEDNRGAEAKPASGQGAIRKNHPAADPGLYVQSAAIVNTRQKLDRVQRRPHRAAEPGHSPASARARIP